MIRIDGLGAFVSVVIFVLLLWCAYKYGKTGSLNPLAR